MPRELVYDSPASSFALALSPLSAGGSAPPRVALGSYVEARGAPNSLSVLSASCSLDDPSEDAVEAQLAAGRDLMQVEPTTTTTSTSRSRSTSQATTNGGTIPAGATLGLSARVSHAYPPSSVRFSPARLSRSLQSHATAPADGGHGAPREMLATSAECLRLWDVVDHDEIGRGAVPADEDDMLGGAAGEFVGRYRATPSTRLVQRSVLLNVRAPLCSRFCPATGLSMPHGVDAQKKADYSAPLTSFSWANLEPTHIVTSSIDTTCTVWDIATSTSITQLIAHDKEVYDVAWSPLSADIFASVGADGSVRMFDLRSLEHSTILYEATSPRGAQAAGANAQQQQQLSSSTSSNRASGSGKPPASPLLRLAFSERAPTYLAILHADAADVQLLDVRMPGTPCAELRAHHAAVNGLAWGERAPGGARLPQTAGDGTSSAGPGYLATCSDDHLACIWDLANPMPPPNQAPRGTAPSPHTLTDPAFAYRAPSEANAIDWQGDWLAVGCDRSVRLLQI